MKKEDQLKAVYAIVRQAELSIDRAIDAPWQLLRDYYDAHKRRQLRNLVDWLPATVHEDESGHVSKLRQDLETWYDRSASFFGGIKPAARRNAEEDLESSFLSILIVRLLSLLDRESKPDTADLIQIRSDLYLIELVMQKRFPRLLRSNQVNLVEHFGMAAGLVLYSAPDIHKG